MTRRRDLDAARAERKAEPLEVVLAGRTFMLPASLPAIVAVAMGEMHRAQSSSPDADDMDMGTFTAAFGDVVHALFGEHAKEAMNLGLDFEDIELLLEEYGPGEAPASAE